MNYVTAIVKPEALPVLSSLCEELALPFTVTLHGRGTAVQSMRELLGIKSNENRLLVTVANEERTAALMKAMKEKLHIGVPGHGIVVAVPVKSVGGGKTVAFLNGEGRSAGYVPSLDFQYELIVAIANEGTTDQVMNAARAAGARGGTVLHAKGTGGTRGEKFFSVSLADEKDMIYIIAHKDEKAAIMRSINEQAGPGTKAGAICFSLPISAVAGLREREAE